MGNKAVQVLKLVLFQLGLLGISFVQIETSSPLFTVVQSTMRPFSQQQFMEESEILQNSMNSFQSIFRVLCYMLIWQYQSV